MDKFAVQYQQAYHLNPENFVVYDAMGYPGLQPRWQAQRGELLGVSASVARKTAGLSSLHLLPDYRHQGIDAALVSHPQQLVGQPLCSPNHLTCLI